MMQQVTDGNLFLQIRKPGQVLADVVVQFQLTLAGQQYYRKGSELFGYRGHMINAGGGIGNAVFEIGHTISFAEDQGIVPDDAYCTTRAVGTVPWCKQL